MALEKAASPAAASLAVARLEELSPARSHRYRDGQPMHGFCLINGDQGHIRVTLYVENGRTLTDRSGDQGFYYEGWLVGPAGPVSLGAFNLGPEGQGSATRVIASSVIPADRAELVRVTAEPFGGSEDGSIAVLEGRLVWLEMGSGAVPAPEAPGVTQPMAMPEPSPVPEPVLQTVAGGNIGGWGSITGDALGSGTAQDESGDAADGSGDTGEQTADDGSGSSGDQTADDGSGDTGGQTTEDGSGGSGDQTADDGSGGSGDQTADDGSGDTGEQTADDGPGDTGEQTADDGSGDIGEQAADAGSGGLTADDGADGSFEQNANDNSGETGPQTAEDGSGDARGQAAEVTPGGSAARTAARPEPRSVNPLVLQVQLVQRHPMAPRAAGTATLNLRQGTLTLAVRGLPSPTALGRDRSTGRPLNAYRIWLINQDSQVRTPVGYCERAWGENFRFQGDGIPLNRNHTILITAEDRTATDAAHTSPQVLIGSYEP